jgi:hypothetical protein
MNFTDVNLTDVHLTDGGARIRAMVISAQRRIGPCRDFFCANLFSAILLFGEDPWSLGLVAAESSLFASTVGPQEPRVAFEV